MVEIFKVQAARPLTRPRMDALAGDELTAVQAEEPDGPRWRLKYARR